MQQVNVTFDTLFGTWNVMLGDECIYYGDVFSVEEWLEDNADKYEEL